MTEVVIVEAVRSPVGKRNGGLSSVHPTSLLSQVQLAAIERSGIDPAVIGQVVGGCVGQIGAQAMNVARTAWLTAGLPQETACSTVDSQCGSSQHAVNLAYSLVKSGVEDAVLACGVESMSIVPMGSNASADGAGRPVTRDYFAHYEFTSQFEGAERMADKWEITREDCDRFGLLSQQRAARAQAEGRFETQIAPIEAPVLDEDGKRTDETVTVRIDEGLRETTLEGLAGLKPVARPNGVHTAGSSSQISDGAGAVLMMTSERATELGLTPRARVAETCLVGCDPVLMLEGPIPATRRLLARAGLSMDDIDVAEVNEAFASVVLCWAAELAPDMERVNPNGGAIALGHPLGGTGSILVTKALHELERTDGQWGLITMCCGGGLGTGTLIERL
ncbi:MAG: steroid 3-ketoacyl-CoA thiolase [bacterium]|nr:steroid 3-ketoacyl-CoA thiolase [bacterium]MCY4194083.1 steroid 3-ketoacyl-CoA thiolase [bacterium]MCY4271090.1 steroid 3-ketoacyl-CoA thiolase [bacterium]